MIVRIRSDPPEPRLQRVERHDAPVAKGENLAVEHHIRLKVCGTRHDLRELRGDVLQIATVQRHLRTATVELASDTVILVFNPDILAESRDRLGGVGNR